MHRQIEYESPEIISHILYAFRRRDRKEKCEKKKTKLGMGMKGMKGVRNERRPLSNG